MSQGRFSLLTFYERRARRIFPALSFVVLCCMPFAWAWMLPRDLKDFSQSLVAVATFSSNILFWLESGYFDTRSELKPLLHTWSLALAHWSVQTAPSSAFYLLPARAWELLIGAFCALYLRK